MIENNTICLVGCGSTKKEDKSYSWDLYESDYFQKRMTVAMLIGQPAILSAEHGLLFANERIEPYDEDMREKEKYQRDSWALSISSDIPDHFDNVVILAGKKYRNPLSDLLKDNFEVYSPFESDDIGGIGDQISWCKGKAEQIVNGEKETLLCDHY